MSGSENAGRRGTRWRRLRQLVFAAMGDTCALCGHPGSGDIDHIVPKSEGGDPWNPDNLRPAHGSLSMCYQCDPVKGRACNQSRRRRRAEVFTGPGRIVIDIDPRTL